MMSESETAETFQATLAEPLNFGHILEICGKTQQNADRICISFSKTKIASNNIDLQILLDFLEKQIILTQFQANNDNNVLVMDLILAEFLNDFKLYIMLGETKFHISLNNTLLAVLAYNRNFSKLKIQFMEIKGQLEYLKQLDHHKYFPYIWPPIQIIEDYLDFSNDQPMAFNPGHLIVITAYLEGNSKGRFIIQFRHARDNKRQELHVSVRFDTKKVIRNSKFRRSDDKLVFGQEEINDTGVFPFEDFKKPFKLAVAFCETEICLAKDGEILFTFAYRSPNILPYIMGPKIFGTNGVHVKVCSIDHLCLDKDEVSREFQKFSI